MVYKNKKTTFPKDTILEKMDWKDLNKDLDINGLSKFYIDLSHTLDQSERVMELANKYPIYGLLRKLLNLDSFLSVLSQDNIVKLNELLSYLMDLDSEKDEQNPENVVTSMDIIKVTSNNQIRKQLNFEYTKDTEIPSSWICMKHIKRKPCFNIHCADKPGYEIKQEIEQILQDEEEKFFNVDSLIPTTKQLQITCSDLYEMKKLMEYLTAKRSNWTICMSMMSLPQILIRGVNFDPNETDKWVTRMIKQNNFGDNDACKIVHFNRGRGQYYGQYNVYLEISQKTRNQIQENLGKIYVYSQRLTAIDYFNIQICGKCTSFGHNKDKCKGKVKRCPFGCMSSHELHENCPRSLEPSKQKCPNCHKVGHHAFSHTCPMFLERLEKEILLRNYAYDWIMM